MKIVILPIYCAECGSQLMQIQNRDGQWFPYRVKHIENDCSCSGKKCSPPVIEVEE